MPMVIAFVSQKGGVGKSTLARALGSVVAHGGLSVVIADLDVQQLTSVNWNKLRVQDGEAVQLLVRSFVDLETALAETDAEDVDVLIIDTPGRVSQSTLDIARASHLIVIPTGPTLDDLQPAVLLHYELVHAGISRARITCALCRTLSKDEERDARDYLNEAGCHVLPGALPERAAYRNAHNRGRAATETDKTDANASADALIEALLTHIASQFEKTKANKMPRGKGRSA